VEEYVCKTRPHWSYINKFKEDAFIMGTIKTIALTATAAAILTSSAAFAACGIAGNAKVSIMGNDFPALHAVFSAAEQCAGDGVTVTKNHNKDYKDLMVPALTANPAEYTALTVSNGTLVTLMNDDLLDHWMISLLSTVRA